MNDKLVTTHCINSNSITYDGDQWVRVEAMVLGDSVIKHIVNGDTVMTYYKPQMGGGAANNTNPGVLVPGKLLSEGFIALQAETAPIDFRKVEIVNLQGCMDPTAANYKRVLREVRSDGMPQEVVRVRASAAAVACWRAGALPAHRHPTARRSTPPPARPVIRRTDWAWRTSFRRSWAASG